MSLEADRKIFNQEVQRFREEDVRGALKKMKSGKVVGPDDMPVVGRDKE